jgi:hypothetical protein
MPIGKPDSDARKHSDKVYRHIIKKALEENNPPYHCIRADEVSRPNNIIRDVVQHLYDADVVIADLTDQNPNVFYELGARHALSGKTILISADMKFLPFDLQIYRTIIYDITNPDSIEDAINKIRSYISDIEAHPDSNDNPILETLGKKTIPSTYVDPIKQIDNIRNSVDDFKYSFFNFMERDLANEIRKTVSSILSEYQTEPTRTISQIVSINKSGISNIYPTRIDAYAQIVDLLDGATQQISLMGISLRKFFHNDTDVNEKIKSFKNKNALKWHVLVLDPESEQAMFRSIREQEGMYREAISEQEGKHYSLIELRDSLEKIRPIFIRSKLYKDVERTQDDIDLSLRKLGFNIDLRFYRAAPVCFMALIDDRLFIEQYHYGALSDTRVAEQVPVFEFARGSAMYYQMDGHFKYVWDHLSRPEP